MNRDINFDIDLENDVEINIEATGFSSSYQDLTNKPKINGVEINGDKTSSDFNIYSKDDVNNLLYFKADKSELEDYVKFTDKATTYDFGIVKPDGNTIKINDNGTLGVVAGQGDPSNYQNLVGKPQINNVTLEGGNTDSDTLDLVKKSKLQKEESTLNTNEDNPININYGSLVVNGNYHQDSTTGKNLASNKYEDYNYSSGTGGYALLPITLEQGATYTLSAKLIGELKSKYYNYGIIKEGTGFSSFVGLRTIVDYISGNVNSDLTFTVDNTYTNPKLVCFIQGNNPKTKFNELFTNYNIQIEKSNVKTSYEPYTGGQPSPSPDYPQEITTINSVSIKRTNEDGTIEETTPINLQNNELCKLPNGVKDELIIENGKVKIIKRVGKVVLNGSENWSYNTPNSVFYLSNFIEYAFRSFIPLSNYFQGQQSVSGYGNINNKRVSTLNLIENSRLLIKDTDFVDVTTFKSWLSTHNTIVYYELATPTEIDLGTITNINFKDYNSISVLTNLNSTYKLISYNKDFDYINLLSDKIESNKSSITTLNNNIVNKVDKIEGKGLSTNDFTTDDKNNLDLNTENRHNHINKSVLDSITTSMITKLNNIVVNTLWTNPDDTVNFTAQQVELSDSLENYNLLVIIIRDSTQDTNYHTTIIAKNDDIFEDYYDRRYVENVSATRQRKYGAVSNTMYSFTNSTDTEGTSRSGSLVPVKIIGIRI